MSPGPDRPAPLNRHQAAALAVILAAAALLRVVNLDHPSFWEDEIVTVQNLFTGAWLPRGESLADHSRLMAQARVDSWGEYFQNLFIHEDSPPLYFVAIRLWSEVFGISEVRLRLFSSLVGFLAVVLFFGLARRLLPVWATLAGTLLFALHPFVVEYSREARPYALVLLLAVAALRLLWVIGAGEGTWWHRALFVAVNSALLYTHYHATLFIAAEAAALLLAWRRPSGLLWLGASAVLFVPGTLTLMNKMAMLRSGQRQLWVQAGDGVGSVIGWLSAARTLPKKYLVGNLLLVDPPWLAAAVAGLTLLVGVRLAFGVWAHWRRDRRAASALLTILGITLTAVFFLDMVLKMNTIQAPRYLIFLFPAALLLGTIPLAPPWGRRLDGVLAVLLAVFLGAGHAWYFTHGKHGFDWRAPTRELQTLTRPQDPVVVDYKRDALLLAWYLETPRRIMLRMSLPEIRRVLTDNPGGTLVFLPYNPKYTSGDAAAFPQNRLTPLEAGGQLVPVRRVTDPRHYRTILYYRITPGSSEAP